MLAIYLASLDIGGLPISNQSECESPGISWAERHRADILGYTYGHSPFDIAYTRLAVFVWLAFGRIAKLRRHSSLRRLFVLDMLGRCGLQGSYSNPFDSDRLWLESLVRATWHWPAECRPFALYRWLSHPNLTLTGATGNISTYVVASTSRV